MPCILRRCGVLPSTPHSSGIVRLASGAFYFAIHSDGFGQMAQGFYLKSFSFFFHVCHEPFTVRRSPV
ncbi:MAG: hypothetical protein NTY64_09210 [Deltaproteobacteria bacterium]|nr:hypothetical protein [Deltaproteobacteria bacterium]